MPAVAIAAALVLLAGAALLVRRPAADVERGDAAQGIASPTGALAAPPEEFRFPDPGEASVSVSVFDADRCYDWTSPAAAPGHPVPFPAQERAKLRPGVVYTWVVLGEGRTLPARKSRSARSRAVIRARRERPGRGTDCRLRRDEAHFTARGTSTETILWIASFAGFGSALFVSRESEASKV